MSMFMLSPGDSLMQGYVADRERDDYNNSETARVIRERGYEPGVLYDNDFLIPEDEAARVEDEEPGLDRSGGIYADDNAFKADGVIRNASRTLHDFNYKIGAYADPNRTFPSGIARAAAAGQSNAAAQRSDDDVAEYGLEAGGALNYHLETQALTAFSDQPDEVKLAIAALLDGYEQLPDGTRAGSMRMFKGMALSPTIFLGAGSIGAVKNLLQFGGKQAAKRTLRDRLLRMVLGAQFIGAEGAGYAAFSDYMMQKMQAGDQPLKLDTKRLLTAAAMGYGFGTFLTGAVAAAPSAIKATAGAVRDMTRPGLRSGVGPIPETPPVAQAADEVATDVDPQGFFSAVSRAVDTIPMDKGSGAQMRAMIAKGEGVKAEEMAWTGLDDFLAGKKSVTKQEVRDFVDANQVQVEEVVRADEGVTQNVSYLRRRYEMMVEGSGDYADLPPSLREERAEKMLADIEAMEADNVAGPTKFGEYTLPGGENYREVLLRLPTSGKRKATQTELKRGYATNNQGAAVGVDDAGMVPDVPNEFRSGHYDEPNVLAHIRLNDRTGPNGERILFVEEIQSDWHQTGRKQGYKGGPRYAGKLSAKEMDGGIGWQITDENGTFVTNVLKTEGPGHIQFEPAGAGALERTTVVTADDALSVAQRRIDNPDVGSLPRDDRVPDAPLKKGWHEMSFRRVARMAAEEGYDAIAWTPGKVQAERYDLSKQIDELRAIRNDDGTFRIYGVESRTGPAGILMEQDNVKPADLENLVGKHLAEKIRGQNKVEEAYFDTDLQVGGEGMEGFYDQMLKKYAEKWGKKFDSKVGVTNLDNEGYGAEVDGELTEYFATRKQAQDYIDSIPNVDESRIVESGTGEVWTMPVTKKMRDSVLKKGVPLFSAAGATAATGAAMQDDNQPASERVF